MAFLSPNQPRQSTECQGFTTHSTQHCHFTDDYWETSTTISTNHPSTALPATSHMNLRQLVPSTASWSRTEPVGTSGTNGLNVLQVTEWNKHRPTVCQTSALCTALEIAHIRYTVLHWLAATKTQYSLWISFNSIQASAAVHQTIVHWQLSVTIGTVHCLSHQT